MAHPYYTPKKVVFEGPKVEEPKPQQCYVCGNEMAQHKVNTISGGHSLCTHCYIDHLEWSGLS